jgi:hypothetical protein
LARKNARIAQESTTATLPALIRCDFGSVLGFEVRHRIPWKILQAAIEDVDGVLGSSGVKRTAPSPMISTAS